MAIAWAVFWYLLGVVSGVTALMFIVCAVGDGDEKKKNKD